MPQEMQRALPGALAVGFNNDAGSIGCGRAAYRNESEKFVQQARENKKAARIAPERLRLTDKS